MRKIRIIRKVRKVSLMSALEPAEFSLSDLNRRPGVLADKALSTPVLLTKHGRPHLLLISIDHYQALGGSLRPHSASSSLTVRKKGLSGLSRSPSTDSGGDHEY